MATRYLTFQDSYEHLADVFNQEGDDGAQSRRLRRAIQSAYQQLPQMNDWNYFMRTGSLNTTPPGTYTVTYVASTGLATITGTWPTVAIYGSLEISNVRYAVKRRVSDTVIELHQGPGSDYTGTARWLRFRYVLPNDVGDIRSVIDPSQYFDIRRVQQEQTWWWQQVVNTETFPLVWSLFPAKESPQQWEIWLSGSGNLQRSLTYMYQQRFTNLTTLELLNDADGNSHTVSIADDVATFSGSVLTDSHIGCVLRVSNTTGHPTGYLPRKERNPVTGRYSEVDTPPSTEHIITAVNSGTEAVLQNHVSSTVTSKGFSISSQVNLPPGSMTELFYRLTEENWDLLSRAEPPVLKLSKTNTQQALRSAMVADGHRHADHKVAIYRGDVIEENG